MEEWLHALGRYQRPQRKEYCFPPLLENVCGVISGKPRHLQNSATSYEGVSGALAVKERLKFHCINLDATCDVCGHHFLSLSTKHMGLLRLQYHQWGSLKTRSS